MAGWRRESGLRVWWAKAAMAASAKGRGARNRPRKANAESERWRGRRSGSERQGDGTAAREGGGGADLRMTLLVVSAGDHCALRMSRQMLPLLFTFGW